MNKKTQDDAAINWSADIDHQRERSLRTHRSLNYVLASLLCVSSAAHLTYGQLKEVVPFLIKVDAGADRGNLEVLQAFDSRKIPIDELTDMYWARSYVLAREQYNWWLVGGDYDLVTRLTDPMLLPEYTKQFEGLNALDKVLGADTEWKVSILSVAPAPTRRDEMVVRFKRTTLVRGKATDTTTYVVNLSYRHRPNDWKAAKADLIRNPTGYQVFAYRRTPEFISAEPQAAGGANP